MLILAIKKLKFVKKIALRIAAYPVWGSNDQKIVNQI